MEYVVEMLNIRKEFAGNVANDNITLRLKKGEVHALLGENGAGKSTLMSVLFGMYQPEAGTIKVNSVYPDMGGGYWCGEYFTDYPITVIAEPNDGYEFIGWRGTVESTESEIEVDLQQNGVVLEAVFLKK